MKAAGKYSSIADTVRENGNGYRREGILTDCRWIFFCARRTQIISRKWHPTFSCEATQRLTGGNTGEIWGEVLCEPDGALLALEVLHAESKGEV